MEPLEQFPSYRQSEVGRYQTSLDQERLRSDEKDRLGSQNVPTMEYACNDLYLRAEKPGVPVNRGKQ